MLTGIIYIANKAGTFDYAQILAALNSGTVVLNSHEQLLLFLGFSAAFAVKIPVFPLHTWLPLTYSEAPATATFLLAAVMSKMGAYGMLRYCVPLFRIRRARVRRMDCRARHHRNHLWRAACDCPGQYQEVDRVRLRQPSGLCRSRHLFAPAAGRRWRAVPDDCSRPLDRGSLHPGRLHGKTAEFDSDRRLRRPCNAGAGSRRRIYDCDARKRRDSHLVQLHRRISNPAGRRFRTIQLGRVGGCRRDSFSCLHALAVPAGVPRAKRTMRAVQPACPT